MLDTEFLKFNTVIITELCKQFIIIGYCAKQIRQTKAISVRNCMFEKYFISNKLILNVVLLLFLCYRWNKIKLYYTLLNKYAILCLRWLVRMWSNVDKCATRDKDKSSVRHPSSWQPLSDNILLVDRETTFF